MEPDKDHEAGTAAAGVLFGDVFDLLCAERACRLTEEGSRAGGRPRGLTRGGDATGTALNCNDVLDLQPERIASFVGTYSHPSALSPAGRPSTRVACSVPEVAS